MASAIYRGSVLPDIGRDVLEDECFTEVFEREWNKNEAEDEPDYPSSTRSAERVQYVVMTSVPFTLSPPAHHLTIAMPDVHLDSLEHCLRTTVSSLCLFCTLSRAEEEWLRAFLRTAQSPLQSLQMFIDSGASELFGHLYLDALSAPHCKVKNLWFIFDSNLSMANLKKDAALKRSLEHLGRSSRSLWLSMRKDREKEEIEEDLKTISSSAAEETSTSGAEEEEDQDDEPQKDKDHKLESHEKDKEVELEEETTSATNAAAEETTSKKEEDDQEEESKKEVEVKSEKDKELVESEEENVNYSAFMDYIVKPVVSQMVDSSCGLKELVAGCIADSQELLTTVCAALQLESCQLTRLDIRGHKERCRTNWKPEMMELLLQSVASSACSIQDLGVPLGSPKLSYKDNKKCCSIFAHAFTSGSSLSKIKTLRLSDINTEDGEACVAKVLGSGQSSCQVRFLEVDIHSNCRQSEFSLFRKLQNVQARIECLRVKLFTFGQDIISTVLSQLADFVRWENCLLLCLQWLAMTFVASDRHSDSLEQPQLQLANSLEGNYLLTFLYFPWTSDAAKSRAAGFLARNRDYKSWGISTEKRVKPKTARLFLCGDGEVGKTTLRKALLKLHRSPWISAAYCSNNKMLSSTVLMQHSEPRTRGLEIHQLAFTQAQKLVIYDLAGQQDYHSFHHFFMSNTSNDLFIVVCKVTTPDSVAQVPTQLEYWFRFIVSHRNTVRGPNPKVLVIVNFFLPTTFGDMQGTAQEITQQLQNKYAEVLDFSSTGDHGNVFGLVASIRKQVKPILQRLKILVSRLLEERPKILELCDDLSSQILPSLMRDARQNCGISRGWFLCTGVVGKEDNKKLFVSFSELVQQYLKLQSHTLQTEVPTEAQAGKRILAALVELHSMGEVVFFPPNIELDSLPSSDQQSKAESSIASTQMNPIIITNPGWFCNQVVGDLLAPEDEKFKGKCQRTKMAVMQIIKQKAGVWSTQFGDEMFRYILNLDLCFIIDDDQAKDPTQTPPVPTNTHLERQDPNQKQVFFPAVATNELEWPQDFNKLHSDAAGSSSEAQFYGRRLKCKETQMHLIPFGVFSRLQVRLRSFCGVGNTLSYKLGSGWSSFVKDGIAVVVRLGGAGSGQNQQEITGHPEWIDILLCCPPEDSNDFKGTGDEMHVGNRTNTTADAIIHGVKRLIFGICQARSLSIPTVELEEWVLRNKDDAHYQDVMPLASIKDVISAKGLGGRVSWPSQVWTPVVELLLPEELKAHVEGQVRAMRQIQAEFDVELVDVARTLHTGTGGSSIYSDQGKSKLEVADAAAQQLSDGQLQILYDLICTRMDARFDRVGVKMEQLLMLVEDIRKDVRKLTHELRRMEVNILNNCSSRLLTEVLVKGTLPVYPYLTGSGGKLKKLKSFLVKETAKLHFLCEAPVHGPHKVEGQAGKEVVIKADGILMKAAPVLVPALRIMCCAARFAANAYLPGIAPPFFDPLLDCLTSLDITSKADLQSEIMTKAVNALFDGMDDRIQHLYQKKGMVPALNEGQMREAVRQLLKDKDDLDMHKDFGLNLVHVRSQGAALGAGDVEAARSTRWVCDAHVHEHTKLDINVASLHRNPFNL